MKKVKTLTIVIPVYNEEKFIEKTLDKVMRTDSLGMMKEIVVVDDCSTDETVLKVREQKNLIERKYHNIKFSLIEKDKNEGKGAALRIGFLKSTGNIVLVQDADLEYDPSDYSLLLQPFVEKEADVVYGSRFISAKPRRVLYFWHYVANVFITGLSNMFTNLNLTDIETGYKVFKGELIRKLAQELQSKQFGFEPEITAKIAKIKGIKIYEVGISYWGRTYEEGKKIGWKDGLRAVWEIFKYNLFT